MATTLVAVGTALSGPHLLVVGTGVCVFAALLYVLGIEPADRELVRAVPDQHRRDDPSTPG